jgi:hypothetical protein
MIVDLSLSCLCASLVYSNLFLAPYYFSRPMSILYPRVRSFYSSYDVENTPRVSVAKYLFYIYL